MRITDAGMVGEHKSYIILLTDDETSSAYQKLFGDVSIAPKVNHNILDDILIGYIKTIAIDELNKKHPLLEGEIYKVEIQNNKSDPIITMVSLHDKIKKIFY